MYGGAITLQGVTNKNIIRIEQPQQDKLGKRQILQILQSPFQTNGTNGRGDRL
jgi:hypothetical protein